MRYLGIRIDSDLYRRLKIVAAEKDLSVTDIVRGLIETWVAKQEAQRDDVRRGSSEREK